MGGFSSGNLMCMDQRGCKAMIHQEADDFLSAKQRLLNATVHTVAHSREGVTVTLTNGTTLSADYALCTFSLGVLQNDDVHFHPLLPRKFFTTSLFLFFTNQCDFHQHSSKKLFKEW